MSCKPPGRIRLLLIASRVLPWVGTHWGVFLGPAWVVLSGLLCNKPLMERYEEMSHSMDHILDIFEWFPHHCCRLRTSLVGVGGSKAVPFPFMSHLSCLFLGATQDLATCVCLEGGVLTLQLLELIPGLPTWSCPKEPGEGEEDL